MKVKFQEPFETNGDVTVKISKEQAVLMGIDITKDQIRGEMETRGPWQMISKYKALVMSANYVKQDYVGHRIKDRKFYNRRVLSNPEQSGYALEGNVSIGGKRYSAFTSSVLFDVEGKIIDVAVIHARINNR